MEETMVRVRWFGVIAIVGLSLAVLTTGPRSAEADDKALGADGKVYLAAASTDAASKPDKADESRAKLDAKLNPWPNQNGFISPTLNGPWRYRFALNAWLPTSVEVTIDDGSRSESVTLGLDFILGHLKFYIPPEFEVRKGSFGVYWHTLGFKIAGSTPVGRRGSITWSDGGFIMDVGFSFELGKWIIGEGPDVSKVKVTVEPIIGARLIYDPVDINLTRLGRSATFDFSNYVPMIGLRTYWDLTEHWNLLHRGRLRGLRRGR